MTRSCSNAGRTSTSSWTSSTAPSTVGRTADDVVAEMLSLGSVIRLDDGTVADPVDAAPIALTAADRAGGAGMSRQ